MAHKVSFDHNHYLMECGDETNAGAQAGAVVSTSAVEAPGPVEVMQAEAAASGHGSRGAIGCATVYEPKVEGNLTQETESDLEETDDDYYYYDDDYEDYDDYDYDDDDDDEDDDDLSISDQDSPAQEEDAPSVATAAPPTVPAAAAIQIPGPHRTSRRHRRRRGRIPFHFAQWQVQEMENLFEETQYPDVLTRRELARTLNVPEIKVKVWFSNRRAKQRKNERRAMLRNVPPGADDFIFMADVEEPS